MASTPPRISSIMNTMLVPRNVYASVVVSITAAVQTPERKVQRPGRGTRTPATSAWLAARHQPSAVISASIPTVDAATLSGRSERPSILPPREGERPDESTLVRALYGAYAAKYPNA